MKLPRLFGNRVTWPIWIFVIVLLAAFASRCRAAEPELWVEVGSTVVRHEAPVLGFAINWPDAGPTDTDYMLSLHLIGERDGMRPQSALGLMLIDGFGRFDIGLGLCLLHHVDRRNGSRANFMLTVAYRFGSGRSAVRERHCSNAGQTSDNKGLDMALYGRRL